MCVCQCVCVHVCVSVVCTCVCVRACVCVVINVYRFNSFAFYTCNSSRVITTCDYDYEL